MEYRYIPPIIDYITKNYIGKLYNNLTECCLPYTSEEIDTIKKLVPSGKKIPLAIQEWLVLAGNLSLAFNKRLSFKNIYSIMAKSNHIHEGKYNDILQKVSNDFFVLCSEDYTEDFFDYSIFPYGQENPRLYTWKQYFDGDYEIIEDDDIASFTEFVMFWMPSNKNLPF